MHCSSVNTLRTHQGNIRLLINSTNRKLAKAICTSAKQLEALSKHHQEALFKTVVAQSQGLIGLGSKNHCMYSEE